MSERLALSLASFACEESIILGNVIILAAPLQYINATNNKRQYTDNEFMNAVLKSWYL
jgi:hypothetical protein